MYEANGNSKPFNKNFNKAADDERKLFVGGLTWETTKENLIKYFSKFGNIEDANIKIDFNTGRSRGFGFVLFDSKEAVEKILNTREHIINGKSIDPKPAKHKGATPIRKVFVGGLDPSVPEADIRKYFGKYGKIEDIEFPFDKVKNQRKSFCFILYETEDVVNEVLKKAKHLVGGKEVDVKRALPPKEQNQQNQMMQSQMNYVPGWNPGYEQYPPAEAKGYGDGMMYYNGAVDGNYYVDPSQNYGGQYDPSLQAPNYAYDGVMPPAATYEQPEVYGYPPNTVDPHAVPPTYEQPGYYQGGQFAGADYNGYYANPNPSGAYNGYYQQPQNGSHVGKPTKRSHSYHPYQR